MADLGGRPVAIESPEQFEKLTKEYIEWVKSNPVQKTVTASFQGVISYEKIPHSRPMTQYGWAAHLGVSLATLKNYGKMEGFLAIFQEYQAYMTAWNIDGATCGDLNGSIIARIEGLADKQDLTTNGESINKPALDVSKLSDEQLRNLDTIIAKASEAGTVETKSE